MASAPTAPQAGETTQKHPGERLASYFDNFFKTIIGISTFGASLTFSKIVQTPVVPWADYGFSKLTVQYYLADAWLFFVLDLAITSFAASALSLYRPQAVEWFGTNDSRERRTVMWYATAVSGVLFGLLTAAFVFIGLVVAAFVGPAGWIAIGATAFFGVLGVGTILWQSPLFRSSIGKDADSITTSMKVYGYMPEGKSDRYTGGNRKESSGYADEKRMAVKENYTGDRGSCGSTMAAHVPITPGDMYFEDRRTSRARRTSAPTPKYYEYENQQVKYTSKIV